MAYRDLLSLPPDMEPGLEGRFYYKPDIANVPDENRRVRNQLFASNAAHGVIVEVDPDTGGVTILKYGVVHDCGTVLNPSIVEGLVQGATAHGIGAALFEEFDYDEQGNLRATTFVGLSQAHRGGDPRRGHGPPGDAVAVHAAGNEGGGGGRRHPRASRHLQRGGERAGAPGLHLRPPAAHARAGVGGN